MKICTFFGHRDAPQNLKPVLKEKITELIEQHDVSVFYVGNHGQFDSMALASLRELTKIYEEVLRGRLSELALHFEQTQPRGEFVIVVEGAADDMEKSQFWHKLSVEDHVQYYINTGETKKDAIRLTAVDRGVPKNEIYNAGMKK